MNVAGVVICGGDSTRMGRSKAWLEFENETLLQRAVRLIRPEVTEIIVAAAANQSLPVLDSAVTRVDDSVAGRGPMQGLWDALIVAEEKRCDVIFVMAVDLPLLRPGIITRMISLLMPDDDAVVAERDGRRQPLAAVYRVGIRTTVERLLSENNYALQALLDRVHVRLLVSADYADIDPQGISFMNINTPVDYEKVRHTDI